jgi:hypothetical protein
LGDQQLPVLIRFDPLCRAAFGDDLIHLPPVGFDVEMPRDRDRLEPKGSDSTSSNQ